MKLKCIFASVWMLRRSHLHQTCENRANCRFRFKRKVISQWLVKMSWGNFVSVGKAAVFGARRFRSPTHGTGEWTMEVSRTKLVQMSYRVWKFRGVKPRAHPGESRMNQLIPNTAGARTVKCIDLLKVHYTQFFRFREVVKIAEVGLDLTSRLELLCSGSCCEWRNSGSSRAS
jgi:hypothetical protein